MGVAEIAVNESACHIAASNLVPGFLPQPWGAHSYGMGKWNMAGCGGYVPATATKWGNWNMDAEVRLIMRPGEAIIEESG